MCEFDLRVLVLKFSVSSCFFVISASSSLSTSFQKSILSSRIKHGYNALVFILIFS